MDIEQARFNMIEQQIRPAGVLDEEVLGVLGRVRRELFVPQAMSALAFAEVSLPLGQGQVMLKPAQEAQVLQALHLRRTDRVLEIGTGSGYMAALLGAMSGHVVSLEKDVALAAQARENLRVAGVDNVQVECDDGSTGWPGMAPYDVIALSGAVDDVPEPLFSQLQQGGRLFAFVDTGKLIQARMHSRKGDDIYGQDLFATEVPPLVMKHGSHFHF